MTLDSTVLPDESNSLVLSIRSARTEFPSLGPQSSNAIDLILMCIPGSHNVFGLPLLSPEGSSFMLSSGLSHLSRVRGALNLDAIDIAMLPTLIPVVEASQPARPKMR